MTPRTPRPISGSTLANGLLLVAAAATLSFAALLLPLSKLVGRARLNVADWAGLLFIPVVILATGLGILHSRRRQHRLLRALGVVDERSEGGVRGWGHPLAGVVKRGGRIPCGVSRCHRWCRCR
jgi:hypothetical protein